jgi:N-acetylglucosamine-6-sulfatase
MAIRPTFSRKEFLAALGCAGLAVLGSRPAAAAPNRPRNLVFMLIDDMRFDAMGFMNDYYDTPHIDALAKGGMVFENCFVTTSLCSPSRASILSGQFAHTHGVLNNSTNLPADTPTFPQELQKVDYETAFVGKWHMGGTSDAPRLGFDHWVSFKGQGVYHNQTFNVNGEHVPRKGHTSDRVSDYAEEYLESVGEEPFCLYLSHKAVHGPFDPPKRHKGSYAGKSYPRPASMANTDENYRGKPAWVRAQRQSWHGVDGMYDNKIDFEEFTHAYPELLGAVDDSVGRVMATLKKKGMLEDTLIIFTSDNGFQFGEHGLIDKRTMYEASIKVPLIAHCPSLFKGGQRRTELIQNIDFAPTLLEAAGQTVPDSIQGRSFYKVLTGNESDWRDSILYEYYWERSFPQTPTVLGVRTERHKFMRYHGVWDRYELYDLKEDPDEMNNLLADYMIENEGGTLDRHIRRNAPEGLKALFESMSGKLDRLLKETGSAREPNWRP